MGRIKHPLSCPPPFFCSIFSQALNSHCINLHFYCLLLCFHFSLNEDSVKQESNTVLTVASQELVQAGHSVKAYLEDQMSEKEKDAGSQDRSEEASSVTCRMSNGSLV